jgi:hypothetical protein
MPFFIRNGKKLYRIILNTPIIRNYNMGFLIFMVVVDIIFVALYAKNLKEMDK